jgi:hypothetical protein
VLSEMPTGCIVMFKENRISDLALMYRLFKLGTSALACISEKMQNFIEDKGKSLVSDPELLKSAVNFTQKLLNFKKDIDEIVEKSFCNDVKF